MQQHLMIFELETAGHHPGYLRHLLHYWPDGATRLTLVVAPDFAARHPAVIATMSKAHVHWLPITEPEWHWYAASKRSLVRRAWVEWRLYCRYAKRVQADQGLIMYIDRFQLPMALRFFLPCKTSGIFFRPKFHYEQFAGHQSTRHERVRSLRERWLWRNALRHPQLKTLFCLDALAVEPLRTLGRDANVTALPDPVEWYPEVVTTGDTLRQALGIEPERKVLLLFGMIDRRKGIYQVLEALQQLPSAQQAEVALLLVGQMAAADRANIMATIDRLHRNSRVQVVVQDCFVPEEAVARYFAMADLVLALYQRHVGSSGILLWAAAAGKPVLASDYGVMGEVVRQYGLGFITNSEQPSQITQAIGTFLDIGQVNDFDATSAAQFAGLHTAIHFVQVLYRKLYSSVDRYEIGSFR